MITRKAHVGKRTKNCELTSTLASSLFDAPQAVVLFDVPRPDLPGASRRASVCHAKRRSAAEDGAPRAIDHASTAIDWLPSGKGSSPTDRNAMAVRGARAPRARSGNAGCPKMLWCLIFNGNAAGLRLILVLIDHFSR